MGGHTWGGGTLPCYKGEKAVRQSYECVLSSGLGEMVDTQFSMGYSLRCSFNFYLSGRTRAIIALGYQPSSSELGTSILWYSSTTLALSMPIFYFRFHATLYYSRIDGMDCMHQRSGSDLTDGDRRSSRVSVGQLQCL